MQMENILCFCDADDAFTLNACQIIYDEMEKEPVDILQFGTNVTYCKKKHFRRKESIRKSSKTIFKKNMKGICVRLVLKNISGRIHFGTKHINSLSVSRHSQ